MSSHIITALDALIARIESPLETFSVAEVAKIAEDVQSPKMKKKIDELTSALARLSTRVDKEITRQSRTELVEDILNERISTHGKFTNDPVMADLKNIAERVNRDLTLHALGKRTKTPSTSSINKIIYKTLFKKYTSPNTDADPLKLKLKQLALENEINTKLKNLKMDHIHWDSLFYRLLREVDLYGFEHLKREIIDIGNQNISRIASGMTITDIDNVWGDLEDYMKVCGSDSFLPHFQAAIDKSVANGDFFFDDRIHDVNNGNMFIFELLTKNENGYSAIYNKVLDKLKFQVVGAADDDDEGIAIAAWVQGSSSQNLWDHMLAWGANNNNNMEKMCYVMETAISNGLHPKTHHARVLERVRLRIQEYEELIQAGQITRRKARTEGLACLRELELLLVRTPHVPTRGGSALRAKRRAS